MTGAELPAAYSVFVGDRQLSASRTGVAVSAGLRPGTYTVFLLAASNCRVVDENPRSATVTAGGTAAVAFSVTCSATMGAIRVTTLTQGVDLDPDGYSIHVEGVTAEGRSYGQDWPLDPTGTATLSSIPGGFERLTLTGISVNCDPTDETQRRVVVTPAETISVAFAISCSPDTGELAFVLDGAPGVRHVYVARASGSGVRRLTIGTAAEEDPAWSPDGKQIAYTTDRDGNREIYVADADGSTPKRLTVNAAADYGPTWSPDGKRIAFVSERDGNAEIYVMNVDGTGQQRLTNEPSRDDEPAWSPDGRIAFVSHRVALGDIFVMNADGSDGMRLTARGGGSHPAWSPDGQRIAYSTSPCLPDACSPVVYTKSANPLESPIAFAWGEWPTWSPDGRRIAYAGLRCNDVDYYNRECELGNLQIGRTAGNPDVIELGFPGRSPAWRPERPRNSAYVER